MRADREPAFILHQRHYSETSLLVEVFSRRYGRLPLLAKGARRPKSPLRASIRPLQPLLLSWSGKGNLPVVIGADIAEAGPTLLGEALYCGFYLNELIYRLLHRHDAHESLYDIYAKTLLLLDNVRTRETALRIFEKYLLRDIGYGLVLDRAVDNGRPIEPKSSYYYIPEYGPVCEVGAQDITRAIRIRGEHLLALDRESFESEDARREVKQLLRVLIMSHIGNKPMMSRTLFQSHKVAAA